MAASAKQSVQALQMSVLAPVHPPVKINVQRCFHHSYVHNLFFHSHVRVDSVLVEKAQAVTL